MIPQKIIDEWLSDPFDQETQNLVKKLMKYPEKLEDAFYTSLNFGTGGIRGIMGVGTNRINKYTLGVELEVCYLIKKSFFDFKKTITSKNIKRYISHMAPCIEVVGYRQRKKGI